LLPTLGITDVQITEGMLANWDRFSEQHRVISVFTCPNAIELDDADGRPPPVNEIAIGNSVYITVDLVRIDYALNAGLLGFDHDSPERPLRGRLAAVQNQARVVLAGDVASHERVPPIPMLCWSPGSPGPVTLGDVLAGKVLFGPKFDRERHQGRMNVAFLDGHVEDLPIEAGALAEAWLVER
jgi:prepilin-type processing-associated H-X9-DG protein